jgi:PBSX family phage terminase large subunit
MASRSRTAVKVATPEVNIPIQDTIIPMFRDVLRDILQHKHTHYAFAGGRGSTKSSFISEVIPLILIANPSVHAVIFRKIGNTMKNSVWAQMVWGIDKMGLTPFFKIPKSIASPIVFLPTGQQILFFGLDDPNKVKSIKLPFGYIGVTWFEELDQFSGEKEIRKVLQSTMRGGKLFWDFRSFNPPISNMNWANQYAVDALSRTNTLVTRNTYLDVPEEWLGQAFIDEALDLKETNPRAYEHEYLGIPVGTGGNVFENVEPMYMTDDFISHFDRVYSGIDWGWYPDPFAFVKCHFDMARRNLYIFAEFRVNKMSNRATFDALYRDHLLYTEEFLTQVRNYDGNVRQRHFLEPDEIVTADSAEPKSISDYKSYGGYGCRPAEKGPDSLNYSMKWLQSLNHIYIDPVRCPETLKEFVEYEYERDKDDEVVSGYPDANNHSIDAARYALERLWRRKGQ